jgi:NitT/TauT family transport system substrate-binding protein
MSQRSRSTFLSAVAAGATVTALPRIARAQGQKLRIAGVFSDLFGEPWFARESGILARAGFDVELSSLANAGAVAAAIGGGALEMGVGDLVSGVNAINAGLPVMLIAGSGMQIATEVNSFLAVPKDSPIKQAKDLVGKTIAVPTLVGLTTASLRAWLPQNGVPLESVKLVEFPQPSQLAAMQKGSIDAGLLSEPFITPVRSEIRDVGHPFDAIGKEFLLSVWYANKAWIEADRERGRKVVAAIYDAARWANTHRNETFAVLVREGKYDPDKLKGMARVTYATSLTPALVQPVLTTATNVKIFDHHIDAGSLITRI